MSSTLRLLKVCLQCKNEFVAQKSSTKYCSHKCASRAYKTSVKSLRIELSNKETEGIKSMPINAPKAKEFLNVKDVAVLLNCSVRSVYGYINSGKLKAVNLSQRLTRVKRSEIDKLFS